MMDECNIECTTCSCSFESKEKYGNHECIYADVKPPKCLLNIKIEPEELNNETEGEEELFNYNSRDIKSIKLEPDVSIEENKSVKQIIKPLMVVCEDIDPLLLENGGTSIKVKDINKLSLPEDENSMNISKNGLKSKSSLVEMDKAFTCKICLKKFSSNVLFAKHFVKMHKNGIDSSCPICNKRFLHKHYVNLHMRVHTGEKPYKCTLCPKAYTHKTSYTIHMRIHNGIRPYVCIVCGKACYDKSGLTSHMRSHTKETPYECETCHRRFTHSKSLLVHRRNHTGEKPYTCKYCGKAFRHWHKHKIHIRLHTGERPYKCKICGKGFPRNDEVTRHMKSHQGIKSFRCSICGVYCATQASITGHINLFHSNLKDDNETPPTKTVVKNDKTGILGSGTDLVQTKLMRLKQLCPGVFRQTQLDQEINNLSKNADTDNELSRTKVIELFSTETPKVSHTKPKLTMNIPVDVNSNKSSFLTADETKPINYKEFMEWQERMLANQGLIVKGYPSKTRTSGNIINATTTSSSTFSALTSSVITNTINSNNFNRSIMSTSIKTDSKAELPLLLNARNNQSVKNASLLPFKPGNAPVLSTPGSSTMDSGRPLILIPRSSSTTTSSAPLLLLSNGGTKMLLLAPQGMTFPPNTTFPMLRNVVPKANLDALVEVKTEAVSMEDDTFALNNTLLPMVKQEKITPPPSPIVIKEEPDD